MAICKLCLKDKKLIKKSHIIPEFMYQGLFDNNHKMFVFKPAERARGEGYIRRASSGEYEGGLLCQSCDNDLLGVHETYASKAIYGGRLPLYECPDFKKYVNVHGLEFSCVSNISYKKIKLFFLSILWRASISTRPLFDEIKIDEHEEVLRKMILNGDPGAVDDYPIFFATMVNDKNAPKDLVAQPQLRITKSGHTSFIFIIGGMIYLFYINANGIKMPDMILTETIKPSNEMNIYHVAPGEGWALIKKFYGLYNSANK